MVGGCYSTFQASYSSQLSGHRCRLSPKSAFAFLICVMSGEKGNRHKETLCHPAHFMLVQDVIAGWAYELAMHDRQHTEEEKGSSITLRFL